MEIVILVLLRAGEAEHKLKKKNCCLLEQNGTSGRKILRMALP